MTHQLHGVQREVLEHFLAAVAVRRQARTAAVAQIGHGHHQLAVREGVVVELRFVAEGHEILRLVQLAHLARRVVAGVVHPRLHFIEVGAAAAEHGAQQQGRACGHPSFVRVHFLPPAA